MGARDPSRNATRHGVLAALDVEAVGAYFSDLTGRRLEEISDADWDGSTRAALALATREAHLDRAHAHHVSCQTTEIDPDMLELIGHLEGLLYFDDVLIDTKREAIRRMFRVEKFDVANVVSRKRLALRYLAEAQSRRDSALRVFVALGDPISRNGERNTA